MPPTTFGVDISARWFDVADGAEVRRFPNTPVGITACLRWLAGLGGPVRVGMEATGSYHLRLATALHAAGHTVFVCNPLSLARYAEAVLARTKTDAADARRIARFCEAHDPAPWSPASPAQQRLHTLVSTRQTLLRQIQQLRNRQHAADYAACAALVAELQAPVLEALAAQIARIDRELVALATAEQELGPQLRLLTSIPGLGLTTAATLLASLPIERLTGPRQVAAYVGLCPQERSSGSSIRGRARTGPLGPAHLRKALYMPALVAMRANPTLRAFADRLRAAGKRPKVIVVAVMRKRLLLAWVILRSGQPYSPAYRPATTALVAV
jgi:transposase